MLYFIIYTRWSRARIENVYQRNIMKNRIIKGVVKIYAKETILKK